MKVQGPKYLYFFPTIMNDARLKEIIGTQWFVPANIKPSFISLKLIYGD